METTTLKQKIWNCLAELRPKEQRIVKEVLFAYEYGGVGDISNVKGALKALLLSFKYDMDNVETYKKDRRSETSGTNGSKGGRPRKADAPEPTEHEPTEKPNDNLKKPNSETEKPKKPNSPINININRKGEGEMELGFHAPAPTLEEVKNFVKSEGLTINADKFYWHYQAKHWADIPDCRAKARVWQATEHDHPDKSPGDKVFSYTEYATAIATNQHAPGDFERINAPGEKTRYKLKTA